MIILPLGTPKSNKNKNVCLQRMTSACTTSTRRNCYKLVWPDVKQYKGLSPTLLLGKASVTQTSYNQWSPNDKVSALHKCWANRQTQLFPFMAEMAAGASVLVYFKKPHSRTRQIENEVHYKMPPPPNYSISIKISQPNMNTRRAQAMDFPR